MPTQNFEEFIMQSTEWTKHFLKNTIIVQEPSTNLDEFIIQICSDGGVRDHTAAFGMVFSLNYNIISTAGMKLVTEYSGISSHRCEAFGLLSALIIYNRYQEYLVFFIGTRRHVQPKFFCDNEALVNTINKFKYSSIPTKFFYSADADIIREILNIINNLGKNEENVLIKHVKGHQDRGISVLNYDAVLNIEADHIATNALRNTVTMDECELPSTKATLWINGLRVSSNHTKHLRDAYQGKKLMEHLKKSNKWNNSTYNSIWWDIHGIGLKSLHVGERTTIQKYLQKRLPSNKRENTYYGYISPYCKKCGEIETQIHILQCQECATRISLKDTYIRTLTQFLESSRLDESTIRVIIANVRAWVTNTRPPALRTIAPDAAPLLRTALKEQNQIGWDHWFKGRISNKWAELYIQNLMLHEHPTRNASIERWGAKIIKLTFHYVLDAWQTRNDIEHGMDDDPIRTKKDKLIRKIMW
jgi:hypothetical protein